MSAVAVWCQRRPFALFDFRFRHIDIVHHVFAFRATLFAFDSFLEMPLFFAAELAFIVVFSLIFFIDTNRASIAEFQT